MSKYIIIPLLLLVTTACTNKQLYQAGQDYKKSDCINKAASESQHYKCLSEEEVPFEEYEQERKEVLENK